MLKAPVQTLLYIIRGYGFLRVPIDTVSRLAKQYTTYIEQHLEQEGLTIIAPSMVGWGPLRLLSGAAGP